MNVRRVLLVSLVITSACKSADKDEASEPPASPTAPGGSAAPVEPSAVTPPPPVPAPTLAPRTDEPGAAAPGSGGAAGSGTAAGSGSAAATADGDAGGHCEAYYQGELKLAREEGWKIVDKHDAFLAACRKLPAELQRCQGDVRYALDNDDACSKLLMKHVNKLRALRGLVART